MIMNALSQDPLHFILDHDDICYILTSIQLHNRTRRQRNEVLNRLLPFDFHFTLSPVPRTLDPAFFMVGPQKPD